MFECVWSQRPPAPVAAVVKGTEDLARGLNPGPLHTGECAAPAYTTRSARVRCDPDPAVVPFELPPALPPLLLRVGDYHHIWLTLPPGARTEHIWTRASHLSPCLSLRS